jgi:hypothetical protein
MHGEKMAIEYRQLESGKQILAVVEVSSDKDKKSQRREKQIVELNLQNGEQESLSSGFRCSGGDQKFIYAIISKVVAKKKGAFAPLRAWAVDERDVALVPVVNPKDIKCLWLPEGESKYPF